MSSCSQLRSRTSTAHRIVFGAFCPGGEVGWILRNAAVYRVPYRIKADPQFFEFRQTAAQVATRRR